MPNATIAFDTDVGGSTSVEWGTAAGTYAGGKSDYDPLRVTTGHSVPLAGLPSSTVIHFRIRTRDVAGVETVGTDQTFTTLGTSSQVVITWTTDVASTSQVDFGQPGGAAGTYNNPASPTVYDPLRVTSHSVTITGLPAGVYHYRVRSRDVAGVETVSADQTFTITATASAMRLLLVG